jgi:hypothetical protein
LGGDIMSIGNRDKLLEAINKSSSLGLAGGITILLSNLVIPLIHYIGLPDFFFLAVIALAVVSFILLTLCFNKQRKAVEDEKIRKSIGYVAAGCLLAVVADTIFLLNEILYTAEVPDTIVIPEPLLLVCDVMLIAAFVFLTYYFIFMKKQRVFSKTLDNIILLAIISYVIKTVLNSYAFVIRILEASEVVEMGTLMLPAILTNTLFILISISLVLFFLKVKK